MVKINITMVHLPLMRNVQCPDFSRKKRLPQYSWLWNVWLDPLLLILFIILHHLDP
jgi:hypothetical protein